MRKIYSLTTGCLVIVMGMLLNSNLVSAQTQSVVPFETALSENQSTSGNGLALNELTVGVVPTVYMKNGLVSSTSNNVVRVICDIESIHLLNEQNVLFNDIELIELKLSTHQDLINLNKLGNLENFTKLRYLYINCSFNICLTAGDIACEIQSLENSLSDLNKAGLVTFYTTSIDE